MGVRLPRISSPPPATKTCRQGSRAPGLISFAPYGSNGEEWGIVGRQAEGNVRCDKRRWSRGWWPIYVSLPNTVQIHAARVFSFNRREPAARVINFNRRATLQVLAAEIFNFNDHVLLQSLAAWVNHRNCSDPVTGIFHLYHHMAGRLLRPIACSAK